MCQRRTEQCLVQIVLPCGYLKHFKGFFFVSVLSSHFVQIIVLQNPNVPGWNGIYHDVYVDSNHHLQNILCILGEVFDL